VLVGFVNVGGGAGYDAGTDRLVFRVVDNGDGTFTFDLKDQVDHTPAAGDNGILTLDLSIAFGVTDFDGDAVTLPSGSIRVEVENDVPQAISGGIASIHVDEDELTTASGDNSTGITDGDADTDQATFTSASLAALVTQGADEKVDFNLNTAVSGNVVTTTGATVLSQGANVIWGTDGNTLVGFVNVGGGAGYDAGTDRLVFRLTDNGDGTFTFDLKDQIDHAAASGDNGTLTLNLTGAFTATDFDGDAVTLNANSIRVEVENDIPQAVSGGIASIHVDEDDLTTASGDNSTGITDGDADLDHATFTSASLANLVTSGADEKIDFNLNAAVSGNVTTTGGAAVLSQGANVIWGTDGGTLVGFVNVGGGAGYDAGTDRLVFRLTDNGDGTFTFDLKDQVDHANGSGDNSVLTLNLTGAFTATDFDGDSVTLNANSIRVEVENDIPQAVSGGLATIHVDEDELTTASGDGSTGITDGDAQLDSATFSSASLANLVTSGADEKIDFDLNTSVSGNVTTTGGAAVLSQGANVIWGTEGGALVGFVNVGGGAGYDAGTDRLVFRLTDNGNGTFSFDLKDQIDHPAGAGDNAVLTLNLTGAFTAKDSDGDAVTLNANSVTVEVENDVPAGASGAVATIHVDEDDLTTASGDNSTGITDGDGQLDSATFTSASLANLVTSGADEKIDFDLNTSVSGNVTTTTGAAVLSQGANVIWGTEGGALVGFVNVGGGAGYDAGTDRLVFRLTDNGNGTFSFDLKDQVDHAAGSGDDSILTLNLTSAFTAKDFDGDAVTLNANSITVEVENDIPAAVSGGLALIHVDEDDLTTASGDNSTGITDGDAQLDSATFTSASLAGLVTPGADEKVDFDLNMSVSGNVTTTGGAAVLSQGANVIWGTDSGALVGFVNVGGTAGYNAGTDRLVFRLTDNGNGTFSFDLKDQLDHPAGSGDNANLTLNLTGAFIATDFDGDAVALNANSIRVEVENDVPALGTASIARTVHEDALNNAQGDGNEEGIGQTTVATGTFSGVKIEGADETGSFSINGALDGQSAGLTSKGGAVLYNVSPDGHTLTAYVNVSGAGYQPGVDRDVFKLTVNAAGDFTFNLIDQIDHLPNTPADDDTQTLVLNLSSAIRFTDFDGDSVVLSSGLSITVQDDIPKLGTIEDGSITNNASASFTGDMPVDIGADEPAKASLLNNSAPADLMSGGAPVHYYVDPADPDTLIAYTGADHTDSSKWVFTLTVDPTTDEYTFNLIKPLDGELVDATIGDASAFGTGPGAAFVLDDGAPVNPIELSIVSGWQVTGFNYANWIATGSPGTVSAHEVNGSTGGWGVDANSFNNTDLLRFDFGDADDFGASDFDPPIFNGPATSVANFGFNSFGGGTHQIYAVVHYTDNTVGPYNGVAGGIFQFDGGTANLSITAPAGKFIDYVEFYANGENGGGKIGLGSTSVINEVVDIDLHFNVDITDYDGDKASGTIDINVQPADDAPIALADQDSAPEGGQVVNAAFVLDFSGSIDNNELNQQLDAVRAAGQEIFAAGAAIISIIIFSSDAANKGTFTDFAAFEAAVNAMNPLEAGGARPGGIGNDTDFTAAIQKTMSDWVPSATTNNQVFFISDGNPNEQLGTGGNSLSDATKTAWTNFINTHDVNVTTIGVGDGIQTARLQDVDLDGSGQPILVADFGALLDTLLAVVGGDAAGNVLANDTPGDGGFQIVSLTVDGVTYTYNGVNITPSNGDPVIAGKVLSVDTTLGGHLTFHFATGGGFGIGDYKYDAPNNVPGNNPVDETFHYVIKDVDGDTDDANLVITVTPNNPPDAVSDVIRTNHLTETIAIPFSVIMANDTHSGGNIVGVTGGVGGTVALDMVNHAVLFTPTTLGMPQGSFSYILQNSDGSVDAATVNLTGVNAQQVNATAPGQILIGNDYAMYFSIIGDNQAFGGLSGVNDQQIIKWNGSSFSVYYNGGELTASGEDIDAIQIIPSGGILFSIAGDNEEFNNIGTNEADNEDIFVLFGPTDTSFEKVTYAPGDGSDTWSSNNLNSLFQFSNGDLVLSFSVATTIDGVTYQPYELVRYTVGSDSFSEFADGMLSSGVIDAVDVLANGNILFSMAADTTLGGTLYEDSDIIRWNGTSFTKYFDGSDHGLSDINENIDGLSLQGSDILVGSSGNDTLMGLGGEDLLTAGRAPTSSSSRTRWLPTPSPTTATRRATPST
jgi:T1SS-143 domain-containing protein